MSKWKQNCQSCHDEIFWNFPPVSREGGGRNRCFQNGIAPDTASSFPRLLAGWRTPQKPPKWNHSAPHTWFSLIFTFRSKNKADSRWRHSQSRTKGQPVEVPTGEGNLLLLDPALTGLQHRTLGHTPSPNAQKSQPTSPGLLKTTADKPRASNIQPWYPRARKHLQGRAWSRTGTKPLTPAHFKPSLCHLGAPQTPHFQEKRERQPNLRRWAKANELLGTENREIAQEEPRHSCSSACLLPSLRPTAPEIFQTSHRENTNAAGSSSSSTVARSHRAGELERGEAELQPAARDGSFCSSATQLASSFSPSGFFFLCETRPVPPPTKSSVQQNPSSCGHWKCQPHQFCRETGLAVPTEHRASTAAPCVPSQLGHDFPAHPRAPTAAFPPPRGPGTAPAQAVPPSQGAAWSPPPNTLLLSHPQLFPWE